MTWLDLFSIVMLPFAIYFVVQCAGWLYEGVWAVLDVIEDLRNDRLRHKEWERRQSPETLRVCKGMSKLGRRAR